MPPLPVVPDVAKVVMTYTMSADVDVINILYFSFTGTSDVASMNALAAGVGSSFGTHLSSHLSNDLTLTQVEAIDLSGASAPVGIDAAPVACTGGTGALSAQTAFLFNHKIARRYRGGKPRTYLPGPRDANLGATDQQWDTTFAGVLNTAFTAFIASIIDTFGSITISDHVNVSFFHGFTVVISPTTGRARNVPTPRATPLVDAVLRSELNPRPATQRRRSLL